MLHLMEGNYFLFCLFYVLFSFCIFDVKIIFMHLCFTFETLLAMSYFILKKIHIYHFLYYCWCRVWRRTSEQWWSQSVWCCSLLVGKWITVSVSLRLFPYISVQLFSAPAGGANVLIMKGDLRDRIWPQVWINTFWILQSKLKQLSVLQVIYLITS